MKRSWILLIVAFVLGGLSLQALGRVAELPLTIFARRFSPAWIHLSGDNVNAPDLKRLWERTDDREEYHAMVLMNEVHGHIGPWSIVGCKMALRAMDLLDGSYAVMLAISEAGNAPPAGCLTDGIVMGGSCTVGRGLLRLSGGEYRPAATFVYEGRAVRLEARPFVAATIRDSIQAIIKDTGGTEFATYWMRVRAFGIQVWEQWDRDEIFAETWVDAEATTSVEDGLTVAPMSLSLDQNAPNPFNAATAIGFQLPAASRVQLDVFDAAGQKVRTLLRGDVAEGPTSVQWTGTDDAGRDVGSGVYFYRLATSDGMMQTRRMCLLK